MYNRHYIALQTAIQCLEKGFPREAWICFPLTLSLIERDEIWEEAKRKVKLSKILKGEK